MSCKSSLLSFLLRIETVVLDGTLAASRAGPDFPLDRRQIKVIALGADDRFAPAGGAIKPSFSAGDMRIRCAQEFFSVRKRR
jgi:hypothetical protein